MEPWFQSGLERSETTDESFNVQTNLSTPLLGSDVFESEKCQILDESQISNEFFHLDSAPTPSREFLIEKLRERSQKSRKRRNREVTLFKKYLKDGSHQYTFWTSSADNQLNAPPLSWAKIYLTIDGNAYAFMWIASVTTVSLNQFTRLFDSPLAVFSDTFATVCANMQWNKMNSTHRSTVYDPPTYCDVMGYSDSAEYKNRMYIGSPATTLTRFGAVMSYPLKFFIDLLGSTYNSNSIMQEYLEASEQKVAQTTTDYSNTTDYRNTQGWKMQFLSGWGVLVPQLADISPLSTQYPVDAGIAIYDYNSDGSVASTIPVVNQVASRYHMITAVDLEYIIHSFEGKDEKEFRSLPYRAKMPLITTKTERDRFENDIRRRMRGVAVGFGFMVGLEYYWAVTWDDWKSEYIRRSHAQLVELPPKMNRPTESSGSPDNVDNSVQDSSTYSAGPGTDTNSNLKRMREYQGMDFF